MDTNLNILIVANLDHASPRIPGLRQYLCSKKDTVRVISPISSSDYIKKWALGELDRNYFKVIDAPYSGDALQILRKILWKFGLAKGKSLTEQLKEKTKQNNKQSFLSKLPNFLLYKFQELLCFPDLEITWYRSAISETKKQIALEKPDILISSSPYMTSHLVASRISKKYKLLWIADYRDTWTNNTAYPFSQIRKKLDLFLEKKIMERANVITTVSDTYKTKLKEILPLEPIVIPNGYTKLTKFRNEENNKTLNVVYTGTIYEGYQNFPEFLLGIHYALENGLLVESDIQVNFYGRYIHELDKQIHNLKLENIVFQNGYIDREDVFAKQSSSDLQLFFNWEGSEVGGLSHLKIYEYFGAMRQILVCGSIEDRVNQELVARTNTGHVCIGKINIAKKLQELSQIKKDMADIPHNPNMDELRVNSYFERSKLLRSEIIKILA